MTSKDPSQVVKLVAGPGVYICSGCIDLCHQIIAKEISPEGAGTTQPERSTR